MRPGAPTPTTTSPLLSGDQTTQPDDGGQGLGTRTKERYNDAAQLMRNSIEQIVLCFFLFGGFGLNVVSAKENKLLVFL